ncbi:cytochrome c biogenesis protein [Candidatus Uabimicrobium sp. HlEnr_7]|uniref:cytochrome c biogenesis protein n=1 Tax=Candidatus Uabimicrobium helgolandensis TaxID=3095367 RepID=UPI003557D1CB
MKETKSLIRICLLLGLSVVVTVAFSTTLQNSQNSNQALAKNQGINWEKIKTLPIQKGGRVMPLDSFARVILTQISGKSSIKVGGKKVLAVEWLVKTVFENSTDDHAIFLIENPRVMEALQLKYKSDRDRYSYNVLKEKGNLINQYAGEAARIEQEERSIFQNQIIHLSNNVFYYESLQKSLRFWKREKNLSGVGTFYNEILPELNTIRVENPNMKASFRNMVHELLTFSYEKEKGIAISRYMYHLYLTGEICSKFGKMALVQKISSIFNSLNNKDIPQMRSEIFSVVPPPQRLVHFLETVKEMDGKKDLPAEMEKEFKHYILHYLEGKVIKKVEEHKFKLTEQGKEVLKNVDQEWKSPSFVFYSTFNDPDDLRRDSLEALNLIYYGFSKNNIDDINNGLQKIKKFNSSMLSDSTTSKIDLEVSYNRYDLFYKSLFLYLFSTIFCLVSWLGWGKKPLFWVSVAFLVGAYICHSWGITLRMMIKDRPPVSTLYESIVFAAWVGVTIAMIMEYFSKASRSISLFTGAISGCILMAIAGKYAMDGDNMAVLVAVLDSNFWLSTHVTSMIIGYSACLVAGAIGHLYILMHLFPNYSKEQAKEVGKLVYGTLCFGTIVAFLGTILGGLWADQSWGRFWGWDPKENGAMLIVLWSVILLHSRLGGYIRDWGLALGAVFGNIVVAAAWWGVNLLSVGLHNYGFTQGLFNKLALFTVIELAFIGFGIFLWYKKNKTPKAQKIATS